MNLEDIAKQTDAFTGADLAGLVRQASLQALKDSMLVDTTSEMDIDLRVHNKHFVSALQHLRPSVSNDVSSRIFVYYYLRLLLTQKLILDLLSIFSNFRTKYDMKSYD